MATITSTTNRRGFTIVELLIVIVVIAILAAITIVAYNGIQGRAENAKTESAVNAYRKALIQYAIENGSYPDGTNRKSVCLGDSTVYSANCYGGTVDDDFMARLRPFLGGSYPAPSTRCLPMYTGCRISASYSASNVPLDEQPHSWYLIYVLSHNASCTLSGLSGGSWSAATSSPTQNGWTEQTSGTSLCRVILPNPATL
ncbi:prepilin-type N-terminal cleavage/methylation domain-containing protein [Candidatus Saccharibacteria bacterium]|nr:prepilin-type N-terminal cleavage/methylation domain-containing protein [Candidatus Saccharibacteria bacterium]